MDPLNLDFRPSAPNVLWVADITYLRSGEVWLYLTVVQDTYSRQIVGWSIATHMKASLVVDAPEMTLARWRPGLGMIHDSDQRTRPSTSAWRSAKRSPRNKRQSTDHIV